MNSKVLGLFSLLLTILRGASATVHVWPESPAPHPPYGGWASSARAIQEAVDVAQPGDTVLVTNGLYAAGGRVVAGTLTNRLTIDKAITVRSVNGPQVTVIEGAQDHAGGNGDGAIRCVYLGANAVLIGFTLTNGHTRTRGDKDHEQAGGGVWCASNAVVNGCVITGNSAGWGGGAREGTLRGCVLTGNSATWGGGAYRTTLAHCTATGNSASSGGGVAWGNLFNCIVYHNTAPIGPNHYSAAFHYSCTTPLPPGEGNIADDPQLASRTHLSAGSPCFGAGNAVYACGLDIDGEQWADPPCMGADQRVSPVLGPLAGRIQGGHVEVGRSFPVRFVADIQGRASAMVWDFGAGMVVSNQPYASHAWSAPGRHPVRLTAYNDTFPAGVSTTWTVEVIEEVYYVNATNPTPEYPFRSWETAAVQIQEAIGAGTLPGRLVLVNDGVYEDGGMAVRGTLRSRVALTNPVVLRSVNGPEATVIRGAGLEGTMTARCAYVGQEAILSGFTLTNGHTLNRGDQFLERSGGGVWCEWGGKVTDCVLTGNAADYGGGAYGGTLSHCTLAGNVAREAGGGVYLATVANCSLNGNSAPEGGGARGSTLLNCRLNGNAALATGDASKGGQGGGVAHCILHHCILTGNSAQRDGGAAFGSTLYSCTVSGNSAVHGGGVCQATLYNCIVYYNSARSNPNYAACFFSHSCTVPLPVPGVGNIAHNPNFANLEAGDFHLAPGSPCIDAGISLGSPGTADFEGTPRPLDGDGDGRERPDLGNYEFDPTGTIRTNWPPRSTGERPWP